jgi:hypothetical protein
MISDRVKYAIVFSSLTIVLLFLTKPSALFDASGHPIPFGVLPGQTLLSVGSCTVLISIIALFIFTWIDFVCFV